MPNPITAARTSGAQRASARMLAEVATGLSAPQKELSPKYFYDQRGSELFEAITRLPEYYPTRAERSILAEGIAELTFGYLGRDPDAAVNVAPTWRDHWDDDQQLPMMIRIDVTPRQGPAWPTLYVTPRESPEAGCRAWDVARQQCAAV